MIPHPQGSRPPKVEKAPLDAPKKLLTPAKVRYTLNLAIQRGQVALCNQMRPSMVSSIKLMSEWLLWCSGCVWMRRNGEWRAPWIPGAKCTPCTAWLPFHNVRRCPKEFALGAYRARLRIGKYEFGAAPDCFGFPCMRRRNSWNPQAWSPHAASF